MIRCFAKSETGRAAYLGAAWFLACALSSFPKGLMAPGGILGSSTLPGRSLEMQMLRSYLGLSESEGLGQRAAIRFQPRPEHLVFPKASVTDSLPQRQPLPLNSTLQA